MIVPESRSAVQLVVNPAAGDGAGLQLARRVEAALAATGRRVRTLVAGDLAAVRTQLERGADPAQCLLCVGGDSTLSELAPVALTRRVPLAAVPTGFGNIFARSFGHRADVPSLLRLIERGTIAWIDVGADGQGLFLSNRGFGLLEDIKHTVERGRHPRSPLPRYLAYVRTALGRLGARPRPSIAVEVDGDRIADDAVIVIVANLPTYPGFLPLAPSATPFDGLLDVVAVPAMPSATLVALLLAVLLGLPGRRGRVRHRRGKHVIVRPRLGGAWPLEAWPQAVPVLVAPA